MHKIHWAPGFAWKMPHHPIVRSGVAPVCGVSRGAMHLQSSIHRVTCIRCIRTYEVAELPSGKPARGCQLHDDCLLHPDLGRACIEAT